MLTLTVSTLPSARSTQLSSSQEPCLVLACVPNAVPATAQVLANGDQIAVWLLPEAPPNRMRPSDSTIEAASPSTKLTEAGLSSAVNWDHTLLPGSYTSTSGVSPPAVEYSP